MSPSRRRFLRSTLLAASAAAACGVYWASTSRGRAARWLRQIVADSKRRVAPATVKPDPGAWPDNWITVCWLGHASVLINFYGVHILTDPVFSNRIGFPVGLGTAGPKRYVAPALSHGELPRIDLVLLSHAHMDHMDLASLKRFPRTTSVVTARMTADLLEGTGLEPAELGWNERLIHRSAHGQVEIEGFEVRHWGRRWPSELDRGYNGYILRREGRAILFGGDTAHTPLFSDLRSRGPFEAAIMPIAAYQPWIRSHCTPEQAVDMANAAGARYFVPVHHLTFRLSEEPMAEPLERVEQALEREPERLALRNVGESFAF